MPIEVECKCGRQLCLQDDLAGSRVRCPDCSGIFKVPADGGQVSPSSGLIRTLFLLTVLVALAGTGWWIVKKDAAGSPVSEAVTDTKPAPSEAPVESAVSEAEPAQQETNSTGNSDDQPPVIAPIKMNQGVGIGAMFGMRGKKVSASEMITIVVDDAGKYVKEITERARELAEARSTSSSTFNGRMTLKLLSTDAEVETLAHDIDFGTVRNIDLKRRMIFVRLED